MIAETEGDSKCCIGHIVGRSAMEINHSIASKLITNIELDYTVPPGVWGVEFAPPASWR